MRDIRHVCSQTKDIQPDKNNKEPCHKPVYKKYKQRCNNNQICNGIKVVYETTYRESSTGKNSKQTFYMCCPGWSQASNRSHGCNKPLCTTPCQNGGTCVKPETCSCPKGYYGKFCENDIDECKEMKPCDQMCYNTLGSYTCQCRENFALQADGQTCRSEVNEPGFEAKDLEYENLEKRLTMIEDMLASNKNQDNQDEIKKININIEHLSRDMNNVQHKISNWENYKNDLHIFKDKLIQVENKMIQVDDLSAKYDRMKKCALYKKICI